MKLTPDLRKDYNPHLLRLRISHKGRTVYMSLGEYLKPHQFSGRVIRHERANQINQRLDSLISEGLELFRSGITDPKQIREILTNEKQSFSFYQIWEERIEQETHKKSIGYVRHLKAVLAKLRRFKPDLDIRDLDYRFLLKFEAHLYDIGNSKNTVSTNMAKIKSTYNYAMKFIEDLKSPFDLYSISYEPGKDKYLTYEEIKKLETVQVVGALALAKDAFLFSLYTAGTRWSDICKLDSTCVRNGRFRYRMTKTKDEINFILTPQALEIYEKYKGKGRLFNFVPDGLSEKKQHYKIQSMNVVVNKNLRKLSEIAGIPRFTFHSARHTFAEIAILNEIPIHTLQKMFGHSKPETTQNYLSSRFPSMMADKSINKMFG